jgi:hypothetical protein
LWTSNFQTGHPFVPLDEMLKILGGTFSRGVLGIEPLSLFPYMLALVAGAVLWPLLAPRSANDFQEAQRFHRGPEWLWRTGNVSGARWRSAVLLGLWMLLPPLLIYTVSLGMPIFTDRYVIWAMPAFLGLVACGIAALTRVWSPLGFAVGVLILALNGRSVYLQANQSIKADFRAAAAYVLARQQPGDAIMYQIPYNRYTFSYYASGQNAPEHPAWVGKEGPYTNSGMSPAEADAWMATRLGAANVVWLVSAEAPMWDQRNLTEQWFASNAVVTDRGEFNRVTVTRYER